MQLEAVKAVWWSIARFGARLLGDRRASIAVNFALLSVPLVAVTGMAIDVSRTMAARSLLQSSIDEAVLAGARDGTSQWKTTAGQVFNADMSATYAQAVSTTFSNDANGNYIGTATSTVSTTLSALLGVSSLDLNVSATAGRKAAASSVCILLLDSTASPGLLYNSGATINAPTCEVHVKSAANPAATFNAGTTLDAKTICVAGTNILDNGGSHANLSKGCSTASDPFAGTLPTPSSSTCTYSGMNINGGNATLTPGVYCYGVNFNSSPNVTLQPGVYVIKNGSWNVTGTLRGNGVTFYFADTSYLQFNGTVTLNLAAPTSGTYANVLIYEAAGLAKSGFSMNATNGATLSGLIYLPSRQLTLNSGASAIAQNLTMVLASLIVDTANWSISPAPLTVSAPGSGSGKIYLMQ